jgi:hypothetical protein
MATNQLDFSKMIFDVSQIPPGTDIVHKFPRLAVYEEFSLYGGTPAGLPHRDNTISYVFYAYDKGCPFQEFKSLTERNDKCLLKAGFKKNKKNEWEESVQLMIKGAIPEVNKMIRCFLFKIQSCRKFNLFNAMENAFQDTLENISNPIVESEADKKERAFKVRFDNTQNAKTMIKDIEELEKELFDNREDIKTLAGDKEQSMFTAGAAERLSEMASSNGNGKHK